MSDNLETFKKHFEDYICMRLHLCCEDFFKKEYGFTLTEFFQARFDATNAVRDVARQLEEHSRNTGITKTVGGSIGVASRLCTIGGLILVPFTAGFSLGLTIGGIVGGVASTGTKVTAEIISFCHINDGMKKMKKIMASLEDRDDLVNSLFTKMEFKMTAMAKLIKEDLIVRTWYKESSYQVSILDEDAINITKWTAKAGFTTNQAMKNFAEACSSLGGELKLLGTAKIFSGTLAAVGIVFSIFDIFAGVKDIKGSEHATAYRKAAAQVDEETNKLKDFLVAVTKEEMDLKEQRNAG